MTGPEHYREAERLIAFAREISNPHDAGIYSLDPSFARLSHVLADAQVHAALALAAATALGRTRADEIAWADVAGTKVSGSS
jgi:hypothetical protein